MIVHNKYHTQVLTTMTSYNPLKNLLKLCQPVKKTRPMSERHVGTAPENVINDENLSSLHIEKIDKDDSSITLIKESIYGNEFLRVLLDEKRLKLVTDAMYLQSYAANANILTENEPGHQLFVSESGYFEVLKGGLTVKRFSSKEVFGELGVLYNCKRQATVRATTPAEVWVLDRQTFQKIMIYSDYQEHEEYVKFLSTVPGLQQLSSGVLFKLSELLEKEFFPSGNVIIRQGDYGDKFYIIRAGHVTVSKRFQNENGTSDLFDVSMGILSAGCFFGELALTKADCRQATVIAQAPGVECLTLERQAFEKYVGSLSKLVNKMYDVKLNDFSKILPTIKKDYTKHSLKDLTPIGILGVGGMASIHLVQSKKDRTKTYALKRIKKRSVELSKEREHIFNEKNVLFSCDTKFICQLYETYKDSKYLYFLLEPCLGGDIWTLLNEEEYLDEKSSKFVVACVVEAFDYLHSRDIIYRDLKPENVMLDFKGYAKLVDFGNAKRMIQDKTYTFCSMEYVAPEIVLGRGHNKSLDYWSLGVFISELLLGDSIFRGSNALETYQNVLVGGEKIKLPSKLTKDSQSIIRSLCKLHPAKRLGCQQDGINGIKNHRWFDNFNWVSLEDGTLKAPLIRPINGPTDLTNFYQIQDANIIDDATEDLSNWDIDF